MRVPRLHVSPPLAVGASVLLEGAAFHHLVRVLRAREGAAVRLFTGEGGEYAAVVTRIMRRAVEVRVEAYHPGGVESPLHVVLAQGVSRGERMDYTLQKAVELGVGAIVPLLAQRSMTSLDGGRLERRLAHWRAVITGACEQCGRDRLPPLAPPQPLAAWLAGQPEAALRLLLDPQAGSGLRGLPPPGGAVTLLVGPEGGLDAAETGAARQAGFLGVRLGPRIMRTETAGVAALAALQALWGDLG